MADASNILRQYSRSFVYAPKAKAMQSQAVLSLLYKDNRVLFASDVEKVHSPLRHLEICGIVVNVNGCTCVFIVYIAISRCVCTASDRIPPVHAKLQAAYIEMDCGPG